MSADPVIGNMAADIVIKRREARLKKAGLSRSYYLNKLKELCECTKPIAAVCVAKPGKDKTTPDANEGTTDFIEIPDNRVQLDAVKTVIELYGDKSPDKLDISGPGIESILERVYAKRSGKK